MPKTSDLNQQDPVTGAVDEVTVIDAAALLKGHDRALVETVKRACLQDGFFFIDPGPQQKDAIEATLESMQAFFSLGDDDARKRAVLAGESRRGWRPRYSEPAYQPDTISSLEAFDVGVDEIERDNAEADWPAVDGFRDAVTDCWNQYLRLADRTLEVIAEAAGLDATTFASRCGSRELNSMRLLHYAGDAATVDERSVGISAHTDFECVTLLYQTAPGLELRSANGHWLDSSASVGRIVVMLDDMLEHWTNGFFKATGHRVRETDYQRFSIVLFIAVDDNQVIGPLPRFVTDTDPAAYAPVTQREHLRAQIERAVENARNTDRSR